MQIAHCENHRCRLTLKIPLVVSTLINAYLSEVPALVSSFQRLFSGIVNLGKMYHNTILMNAKFQWFEEFEIQFCHFDNIDTLPS